METNLLYYNKNLLAISQVNDSILFSSENLKNKNFLIKLLNNNIKKKFNIDLKELKTVYNIQLIDKEISGIILFATNKKKKEEIKNLIGSNLVKFNFLFLTHKSVVSSHHIECNLPLAFDINKNKAFVSHKIGKKANTVFEKINQNGLYAIWQATTSYLRIHQIPLHASESNLKIVGDEIYSNEPQIYLSSIKKNYKSKESKERPLKAGSMIHLREIIIPGIEPIKSPLPSKFSLTLKRLGFDKF